MLGLIRMFLGGSLIFDGEGERGKGMRWEMSGMVEVVERVFIESLSSAGEPAEPEAPRVAVTVAVRYWVMVE